MLKFCGDGGYDFLHKPPPACYIIGQTVFVSEIIVYVMDALLSKILLLQHNAHNGCIYAQHLPDEMQEVCTFISIECVKLVSTKCKKFVPLSP